MLLGYYLVESTGSGVLDVVDVVVVVVDVVFVVVDMVVVDVDVVDVVGGS